MGPADEVTSHLYSWGFRGKQFQYVEGSLPEGVKFHGRLTDHDVRKIQDVGGRVSIIDAHYTQQELDQSRRTCSLSNSETSASGGKPNPEMNAKKEGTKGESEPSTSAVSPGPAGSKSDARGQAIDSSTAVIKSTPDGADIILDGKYVGSSLLQ